MREGIGGGGVTQSTVRLKESSNTQTPMEVKHSNRRDPCFLVRKVMHEEENIMAWRMV
jgi:hypothetical protein